MKAVFAVVFMEQNVGCREIRVVVPGNVFLHKSSFTSIDYVTRVLKD